MMLTTRLNTSNFAYERPTRDEVFSLFIASVFYEMGIYIKFCKNYISALYPDEWLSIPVTPSIEHAVQGVLLGKSYCNFIGSILRPAFYDLARAPLLSGPLLVNERNDAVQDPVQTPGPGADDAATTSQVTVGRKSQKPAERKELEKLTATDLVTLLDLQKRLALTWDDILPILKFTCRTAKCITAHDGPDVRAIKQEYPYDPIMGIRQLLNRTAFNTLYCSKAAKEVKQKLQVEGSVLWDDFQQWMELSDPDMMAQDD